MTSHQAALTIFQQAVFMLTKWAGITLPEDCQYRYPADDEAIKADDEPMAIKKAKEIFLGDDHSSLWKQNVTFNPLRLLFDRVTLDPNRKEDRENYVPARAIADSNPEIPYPTTELLTLEDLKQTIREQLEDKIQFNKEHWDNLSLLSLVVEKFSYCIGLDTGLDTSKDIAFFDLVRSIAAVASSLANDDQQDNLILVAGDLSGIQDFIYTISSEGALKSLRARSFYLGLVAEEISVKLLEKLGLPRTNIIYTGGGNLYILAPNENKTKDVVQTIQNDFNEWLFKEFIGKVFLALDCSVVPIANLAKKNFSNDWDEAIKKLNKQKNKKFYNQLSSVLNIRKSYSPKCKICHRDDTEELDPLNTEEDTCSTCRTMDDIGKELLRVKYIVRSSSESNIKINNGYYHILQEGNFKSFDQSDALYLVNNWELKDYRFQKFAPFVIGNYAKESEEELGKIIRVGELARNAKGTDRVGYLRMDVDNLGRIFSEGLGSSYNLPRLASLSRQLSSFFTVYLNKLAEAQEQQEKNLVFIYAGGDDLFICGSWNELVDFSFEIYNSFRSYTGYNPYITLSGGICLGDIKFPSYQAAFKSGEAEEKAKGNGKDSLGLFGEVFKWGEWLGEIEVTRNFDQETVKYLEPEPMIEPFGVLPLVELLNSSEIPYSRSFIRNLLITAELQEQKIKEAKDKEEPYMDLRYYLHLPKIAYTLARLPQSTRQTDAYNKLSKSLKSPHNAPYFRAIATWIELLNRKPNESKTND